jgi:hypothetical protein
MVRFINDALLQLFFYEIFKNICFLSDLRFYDHICSVSKMSKIYRFIYRKYFISYTLEQVENKTNLRLHNDVFHLSENSN